MPELRDDLASRSVNLFYDPPPSSNRVPMQQGNVVFAEASVADGRRVIHTDALGEDQADTSFGPSRVVARDILPGDAAR
jgi:hypothetical protein